MTAILPSPALLWATAPAQGVHTFDTYDDVCASIDTSMLLDGSNIYCSLDGGLTWHEAGHRDAPPPTVGLAGEIARLAGLELPGYGQPYLTGPAAGIEVAP